MLPQKRPIQNLAPPAFVEQNELAQLLVAGHLMLDVRSEREFEQARIPGSINRPILENSERAAVGTCYKREGQAAAITLGQNLVAGEVKRKRVEDWCRILEGEEQPILYCARGGLRSKIAQEWIVKAGIPVRRVRGGYKLLRQILLSGIDMSSRTLPLAVVAGPTGSGKTRFLRKISHSGRPIVDLEGLANHRGSAFGVIGSQPHQASFENYLAVELLKLLSARNRIIAVESESRAIGRVWIPQNFFNRITESPVLILQTPFSERVANIIEDYVQNGATSAIEDPAERSAALEQDLLGSIQKISRRLGRERAKQISEWVGQAMHEYRSSGELDAHRLWVEPLLTSYYDPLYEWSAGKYQDRIVLQGGEDELKDYFEKLVPLN